MDEGWAFGQNFDEDRRSHPMIKPYNMLGDRVGPYTHVYMYLLFIFCCNIWHKSDISNTNVKNTIWLDQ